MEQHALNADSVSRLWSKLDPERLNSLWQGLVSVGVRAMGTRGADEAVNYLEHCLEGLPLEVERLPFRYRGWRMLAPPALRLLRPERRELDAEAFLYSGSTPPGGLRARIAPEPPAGQRIWDMYTWERWRLIPPDGDIEGAPTVGYLSGRPGGPAIPQLLPDRSSALPHFVVGERDAALITRWQRDGAEIDVQGTLETEMFPDATGLSISARPLCLRGGGDSPELVICAHYDTVYTSPGAYDNGSGSGLLLELAHALSALSPREAANLPPIRLIWFGAEELGLSGSQAYVQQREEAGTLQGIRGVLNLDGFGRYDPLELWAGPEDTAQAAWGLAMRATHSWEPVASPPGPAAGQREFYEAAAETASRPPQLSLTFPPPPGSDHTSFYERGVPVVMLTYNDQELIHRSADICEPRMLGNMLRGGRVALTLAGDCDSWLPPAAFPW